MSAAAEAAELGSPAKSAGDAVAAAAAEAAAEGGSDAELPKALLKRILKARLAQADIAAGGDGKRDFQISKDALLACSEAGRLFIHYLAATANDACRDAKRQTLSGDDVLTALEDLDFGELVEPLKAALEAYKAETKEKAKKRTEQSKKRKTSEKPGEDAGAAAAAAAAAGEQQGTLATEGAADGAA